MNAQCLAPTEGETHAIFFNQAEIIFLTLLWFGRHVLFLTMCACVWSGIL